VAVGVSLLATTVPPSVANETGPPAAPESPAATEPAAVSEPTCTGPGVAVDGSALAVALGVSPPTEVGPGEKAEEANEPDNEPMFAVTFNETGAADPS
jgi:hypothetical protein